MLPESGDPNTTFEIEFVTIGNPGNASDVLGTGEPVGSLPYTYRISKFEISEDMVDIASALGGLGLTHFGFGANKPATQVSWKEATRFVNWLNLSSGSPLAYKFALQPGEGGYSANANIELWTRNCWLIGSVRRGLTSLYDTNADNPSCRNATPAASREGGRGFLSILESPSDLTRPTPRVSHSDLAPKSKHHHIMEQLPWGSKIAGRDCRWPK